ncbi:hypothetical protein P7D22_21290 [Lichenihabitans sp. Uapishka_5]|nr:hypothetical protein [Lichenihabitans sp. Uapishka_5]MDX7953702.1 hypothetical protein [Lichenihabitans sp. Uapishka_5]
MVFGLAMAYSGAGLYAWRKWEDRRRRGLVLLFGLAERRFSAARR